VSPGLDVRIDGGTWIITLDRPEKLNALDAPTVDRLLAEVKKASAADARLLVFRGSGRSFCAGFDLSELESQSEGDLVLRFVRIELLLQAVATSPARTLALVHGKVFGAGVDLVSVCRHRVATSDTMFRMPGLKFGLVLGTRRFARIVGHDTARSLLEASTSFGAARACEMNFIHEIADSGAWDGIIEGAARTASALDDTARRDLYQAISTLQPEADLAALVRSAARPGLKQRLLQYAAR
jgi:enoyl-CoA hydratase/carnithine racemase